MAVLPDQLVEPRIDLVLTQYRESPRLLHLIRTYLRQVEQVASAADQMLDQFWLDTAVGDQLTLIGKRMGWPRCHCVCDVQPVFGFECEDVVSLQPVAGFCDANVTWVDCGPGGIGEVCISDDETYRRLLQVRSYQMLGLYDISSLETCVRILWGDEARVMDTGHGRVVVAPGRELTQAEVALLQLYPRVLPLALGMEVRFHFDTTRVFGFGEGWGGFCEEWEPDGLPLATETGDEIVTEDGESIGTGPLTRDAVWMCEIDVQPYGCA